jgi:uncharacterized protein YutE (UPF0331/DUF86 family)
MNDVVINKAQSIQRCVARARQEREAAGDRFAEDYSRQDAAILNVTRACEQAIDLANHTIRTAKAGIPTDSGESFDLLARAGIITAELAASLKKMVGFRNTVIREYQLVDMRIVEAVIASGLDDLIAFADAIVGREAF